MTNGDGLTEIFVEGGTVLTPHDDLETAKESGEWVFSDTLASQR